MKSVKNFGFWVVNKIEDWRKNRVPFFSYRCFRENNKSRCEKNISDSDPNFLFICGITFGFQGVNLLVV